MNSTPGQMDCHAAAPPPRPRVGLEIVRRFGLRWTLWRAGYAVRLKTGLLKRRFPTTDIDGVQLADLVRPGTPTSAEGYRSFRERSTARFFFDAGRLPEQSVLRRTMTEEGQRRTLAVADDFACGRFLYYSRHVHDLGQPVDWMQNPWTRGRHTVDTHWCDYPTFSPELGDIKDVWEPSRFAAAFWLVRAYALGGEERYAEAFWALFESWRRQNPPNRGPNWKCGQETALRTMAWSFALYGLWSAEATTSRRVQDLATLIALQAERIVGNINFAISQKNNHALSEAVGLLTVGLLFPELAGAARWERIGRATLEQEIPRQVYEDGSFVQHSMNYHRVMMHDLLWAIRLADLNDRPLSNLCHERLAQAGQFLLAMQDDEASGRVPNYGPNDGALVLPLSSCDYTDHRPIVQAAQALTTGRTVLPPGRWDELTLWILGKKPLSAGRDAARPGSRRFDAGGYYTIRGEQTWCMIRCHSYRDRPAHVDPLHVDLWYRGRNVLGDSGTYKYFAADRPTLERYFKDIAAHNTIEIDGRGPLELVSRFLWLPWPKARCLKHEPQYWEGESYAYQRVPWHVLHRRIVELIDGHRWRIVDEVSGTGRHRLTLRWHLLEAPCRFDDEQRSVRLSTPERAIIVSVAGPAGLAVRLRRGEADETSAAGWSSEYYAELSPRPTLEADGTFELPTRLTTTVELSNPD